MTEPACTGGAPALGTSRGLTLTELLVVVVIASVMMSAFIMPFVAERIFWRQGQQQVEAQRDAQLVLHAISRIARECNSTAVSTPGLNQTQITLNCPRDTTPVTWAPVVFLGGSGFNGGQLRKTDQRTSPSTATTLIDGIRSKVQEFTASFSNKILYLRVRVSHKDSGSELMETRVLLRNAS